MRRVFCSLFYHCESKKKMLTFSWGKKLLVFCTSTIACFTIRLINLHFVIIRHLNKSWATFIRVWIYDFAHINIHSQIKQNATQIMDNEIYGVWMHNEWICVYKYLEGYLWHLIRKWIVIEIDKVNNGIFIEACEIQYLLNDTFVHL